jgi:hypothetical protein
MAIVTIIPLPMMIANGATRMKSLINEIAPAPSHIARAHFDAMLQFETDCWDTHASLQSGIDDFILVDVRSPALYHGGHIEGAINIPPVKPLWFIAPVRIAMVPTRPPVGWPPLVCR